MNVRQGITKDSSERLIKCACENILSLIKKRYSKWKNDYVNLDREIVRVTFSTPVLFFASVADTIQNLYNETMRQDESMEDNLYFLQCIITYTHTHTHTHTRARAHARIHIDVLSNIDTFLFRIINFFKINEVI